jgi:hypothetical protein
MTKRMRVAMSDHKTRIITHNFPPIFGTPPSSFLSSSVGGPQTLGDEPVRVLQHPVDPMFAQRAIMSWLGLEAELSQGIGPRLQPGHTQVKLFSDT